MRNQDDSAKQPPVTHKIQPTVEVRDTRGHIVFPGTVEDVGLKQRSLEPSPSLDRQALLRCISDLEDLPSLDSRHRVIRTLEVWFLNQHGGD